MNSSAGDVRVRDNQMGERRATGPAPAPKGWFRCKISLTHLSSSFARAASPLSRCPGTTRISTNHSVTSAAMPHKDPEARRAYQRTYYRAYYEKNREKIAAQQAAWYEKNRDKVNERARKWAQANPEKVREASRAWYKRNPAKHKAAVKRARLANRDGFNETRNRRMRTPKGRAERTERNQRRIARMLGNDYETITLAAWAAKLAEYEGRCAYCGDAATERDHVVPLVRGGSHTLDNLVPACGPCNRSKGDKLLSEWEAYDRIT
jgi:5-methylcytosine-specific restriction endonuclease McrA